MARNKKQGTGPTRDINKTIGDLGLDPGLDPEIAAQLAAEEVANSGEDDEIASTVVVDDVDDDVADALAEDEDDGGRIEIPPPAVEDAEIPAPAERALVPSPKTTKGKTREKTSAASKLGKSIAEKVPGAEKIKVYKRERGQRWFINDYTKGDLATFPDFESFLVRYVQPEFGAGEYDLVGVDAANREYELGQVRLKGVPQQTAEGGAINLLQQMMAKQDEQAKEHIARMEKMMAPQQDPLALLAGMMNLSEQLERKHMANQGDNGMAALLEMMGQSSDKSMQMMMMMMMQQQQAAAAAAAQQQQLMMTLMAPKSDPFMDYLKAKMMEDGAIGGGGSAPLPPPAPPQKESTAELITALAGFMAAMGGGGGGEAPPPNDDFKDLVKALIMKQQNEGLGVKEIIALLLAEKNKPGTDDFRHAVDNMAAIMNIANNINRQQEGGPAAGFFDAVAALFGNRDFAGSIANTLRAKAQSGQQQQVPPNAVQQLALQNQHLRQQLALAQQGGGVTPPQQGAPQTVVRQAPRPQPSAAPPQNVAPEPTSQEGDGLPELPANTADHINNMIEATDEPALVEAVINLFIYYAEFEEWKVFSENFFDHVRRGNHKEALRYLGALFGGLAQQNIIDREMAMKILGAFKNNFTDISAGLDDIYLAKDQQVSGDDLLAVPEEEPEEEESESTE